MANLGQRRGESGEQLESREGAGIPERPFPVAYDEVIESTRRLEDAKLLFEDAGTARRDS